MSSDSEKIRTASASRRPGLGARAERALLLIPGLALAVTALGPRLTTLVRTREAFAAGDDGAVAAAGGGLSMRDARSLRVCADSNNLPFSNARGEGFENRIAALFARDLGMPVAYTWWPQRRGFVRNTLNAGLCDVVLGVPAAFELAQTTTPYYRSTYVFVSRRDRGIRMASLDDPALRRLRIGIHVIGDDYTNTPASEALAKRGIVRNVVGYSIYGDYSKPDPPADLVRAVAAGDVDVAIVWGPLAGYFAKRTPVPLDVVPVSPQVDLPFLPFVFDISMAVRRGDTATLAMVERELHRRRSEIRTILEEYGVPLLGGRTP